MYIRCIQICIFAMQFNIEHTFNRNNKQGTINCLYFHNFEQLCLSKHQCHFNCRGYEMVMSKMITFVTLYFDRSFLIFKVKLL